MRTLPLLLTISLLAACKGNTPPTAEPVAPDDTVIGGATKPDAPKVPEDGMLLQKYEASDAFKTAWEAAIKGGSMKAMCQAWLGDADKGECHEDIADKRVALGDAHAIAFSVEVRYTEDEGGMGYHQDIVLMVGGPQGFFSETLAAAHNGGNGYAGGSASIESLEAKELLNGGAPELLLTVSTSDYDGDTETNTSEFRDEAHTGIVQLSPSGPRWRMYAQRAWKKGTTIMIEGEEPTPKLEPPEEGEAVFVWIPDEDMVEVQHKDGKKPIHTAGRAKISDMPQYTRDAP